MFTFSLSGLEIKSGSADVTEVEESEVTARSACYLFFSKMFAPPRPETFEKVIDMSLYNDLMTACKLLPFCFDLTKYGFSEQLNFDQYSDQYKILFGQDGELLRSDPILHNLDSIKRDYEYFGLSFSSESDKAIDHLATQLEFLQYITFKEAATTSARLASSYRGAQRDFLKQNLTPWVPVIVGKALECNPIEPFNWVLRSFNEFIVSDYKYVQSDLGS
jgi:hypothetical protein